MATKTDKRINLNTAEPATRKRLYRAIRSLPEGTYAIDVAPQQWKASNAQRGYYWGYLIVEVGKLVGSDRDRTDKLLNALFLAETVTVDGESIRVVGSFSSLDNVGLSNYFASIRMWVWGKYRVRLHEPDSSK